MCRRASDGWSGAARGEIVFIQRIARFFSECFPMCHPRRKAKTCEDDVAKKQNRAEVEALSRFSSHRESTENFLTLKSELMVSQLTKRPHKVPPSHH
jgi:hypothetical protein